MSCPFLGPDRACLIGGKYVDEKCEHWDPMAEKGYKLCETYNENKLKGKPEK